MLNRAKVEHRYERVDQSSWDLYPEGTFWEITLEANSTLEADDTKVMGYTGFSAHFYFDEHGRLLKVGVWE